MPCKVARIGGLRGVSSIRAAASVQVIEGLLDQPVESPRSVVFGDLTIPGGGVKLGVPRAKCCHLIGRQLLDRGFDFFDGAHGRQYIGLGYHRQRFFFGLTGKLISGGPWA
jgi:hypothetical protein